MPGKLKKIQPRVYVVDLRLEYAALKAAVAGLVVLAGVVLWLVLGG